jgi:hypothetical protein
LLALLAHFRRLVPGLGLIAELRALEVECDEVIDAPSADPSAMSRCVTPARVGRLPYGGFALSTNSNHPR